jgi:intein-encoded DNA endonuclease-like protein
MPTPQYVSDTQRLADVLLDGRLEEFVREKRKAGRSWRLIALDLRDAVGVDLTYQTLCNWYPDQPEKRSA